MLLHVICLFLALLKMKLVQNSKYTVQVWNFRIEMQITICITRIKYGWEAWGCLERKKNELFLLFFSYLKLHFGVWAFRGILMLREEIQCLGIGHLRQGDTRFNARQASHPIYLLPLPDSRSFLATWSPKLSCDRHRTIFQCHVWLVSSQITVALLADSVFHVTEQPPCLAHHMTAWIARQIAWNPVLLHCPVLEGRDYQTWIAHSRTSEAFIRGLFYFATQWQYSVPSRTQLFHLFHLIMFWVNLRDSFRWKILNSSFLPDLFWALWTSLLRNDQRSETPQRKEI